MNTTTISPENETHTGDLRWQWHREEYNDRLSHSPIISGACSIVHGEQNGRIFDGQKSTGYTRAFRKNAKLCPDHGAGQSPGPKPLLTTGHPWPVFSRSRIGTPLPHVLRLIKSGHWPHFIWRFYAVECRCVANARVDCRAMECRCFSSTRLDMHFDHFPFLRWTRRWESWNFVDHFCRLYWEETRYLVGIRACYCPAFGLRHFHFRSWRKRNDLDFFFFHFYYRRQRWLERISSNLRPRNLGQNNGRCVFNINDYVGTLSCEWRCGTMSVFRTLLPVNVWYFFGVMI